MKTSIFLSLTVCVQVLCVFLQIHKQSTCVKLVYERQRYEMQKSTLLEQKKNLTKEINNLRMHSSVIERAHKELSLQPVSLKQIRSLAYENT